MRIDRLIISHLDADHYSLMPGLVERFVVGAVWCSQPLDTSTAGRRLQRCFAQHDIEVRRVSSGLRTRSGACELVVLQPPWEVPWDSDNANSLVLRVRYRGRSVLLPGDLEGRGLDQLLCTPVQRHTCVMLPHHGSLESRPRQFAKWAFAKRFVVSGGDAEDYQPLLSLLGLEPSGFWHTAVHGAVRWTIDQRGMDKITAVYCPPLGQGRPLAAKRRAFGNTRP